MDGVVVIGSMGFGRFLVPSVGFFDGVLRVNPVVPTPIDSFFDASPFLFLLLRG
jgi:hypothetical protein